MFHTDSNVLIGAPTGSGKTIMSELAMLRVFKHMPNHKIIFIAPLKALAKEVETHIQEQEEIWSTFAAQRLRPLEILQELTALFNKKKF